MALRWGFGRARILLLVHRQHALGDEEAAEDIHRGEDQSEEAEDHGERRARRDGAGPDRQQRADHDHRGDRIGDRHQRRVQRRRHVPHDVIADEHRQHEDREKRDEGIDHMFHGDRPLRL